MVRLSELRKMEVESADGKFVGLAEDATITEKWEVAGLSVNVEKELAKSLGKKTPLLEGVHLEIAVGQVKSIGDHVLLSRPASELGEFLGKQKGAHRLSTLIRMRVVSNGGKVLGWVQDVQLEPSVGVMPSLEIRVGREVMEHVKGKKPLLGKGRLTLSMVHVSGIKAEIMLDTDHLGLARLLDSPPAKER